MGNEQSTNYSIDSFIAEINLKDILNIPQSDIRDKIRTVHTLFMENKNLYIEFRNAERETEVSNSKRKDDQKDPKNSNQFKEDDENKRTIRFCTLICSLFLINYNTDYQDAYVMLLDIMKIMCKS